MSKILSPNPSLCRRSFRIAAAALIFLGVGATLRAVTVLDNTFDPGTPGLLIPTRNLTPANWYATPFTTDGFESR